MKDNLKADSVKALKARDQIRVDVLRYLISLIDKKMLQLPPGKMTEEDEVAVLRKELKNKEEARSLFLKGGRDDLVKQLDYEIAVVNEYLPKEMSEADLLKIVEEALSLKGNNFGLVMGEVMSKVAGRVGGDKVATMVRDKIK